MTPNNAEEIGQLESQEAIPIQSQSLQKLKNLRKLITSQFRAQLQFTHLISLFTGSCVQDITITYDYENDPSDSSHIFSLAILPAKLNLMIPKTLYPEVMTVTAKKKRKESYKIKPLELLKLLT